MTRPPRQTGVHFVIRLPQLTKDVPTFQALKILQEAFSVPQAFYNNLYNESFAFDWETVNVSANDPEAELETRLAFARNLE